MMNLDDSVKRNKTHQTLEMGMEGKQLQQQTTNVHIN